MDEREQFRFSHPVEVRYGDLDAQGHLNHARYLTFMELARFKYMERLGLFQPGQPWERAGMIVAEAQCAYKAPVHYPDTLNVYVRAAAVGNKSFKLHYRLERAADGTLVALGRTVQVAYDYTAQRSVPVPDHWRTTFNTYEGQR